MGGNDMADETELQAASGGASGDTLPPNARALLRTVYIMGVILVLLLIALVGGIIWKATQRGDLPAEGPALLNLGLAADETVAATALDGDRLAVTTDRGIVVVDLRRNRVTSRIAFHPQ